MAFVSNPEAYDIILLGGHQLPGEVHLGEVKRELAQQPKRGSGDDGAEPVFRGLKPCDFSIVCNLHTDKDEEDWVKLRPILIDLNNPANRNQLSVVHPQLQRMGISRCVVHGYGETTPLGGGPIKVTIMCSSVKVKSGGTTKPKPTKNVVTGAGTPTPYRPGLGPLNRYNALPLNVRSASALEVYQRENNIPIDLARPDGLER